jgi:hypothetical protein
MNNRANRLLHFTPGTFTLETQPATPRPFVP